VLIHQIDIILEKGDLNRAFQWTHGGQFKGEFFMRRLISRVMICVALSFMLSACGTMGKKWDETKNADTIEAYQQFIDEYPDSKYRYEARKNIESLKWESAKTKNTIQAYKDFLRRYPRSTYKKEAASRLEDLRWEKVKAAKSIKKFLKQYPKSRYRNDSRELMEDIRWENARNENELKGYLEYLRLYHNGKYRQEAKIEVAKFKWNELQIMYKCVLERAEVNGVPGECLGKKI
jgi:Tetratricopeptide repeat